MSCKIFIAKLRHRLGKLSFRTGVVVGALCLLFYAISFVQFLLPLPVSVKGVLWVAFFGLAKTAQYTALLILGKAGIEKLKSWLGRYRAAS